LGQVPYGYDLTKAGLVENDFEKGVVADMREYRNNDMSLREICKMLNEQKIKTKNNKRWQATTVAKILRRA